MKKDNRRDILILILLAVIGLGFFCIFIAFGRRGSFVQVEVDGKTVATYLLSEDGTYIIEGINNGTNLLVVHDGCAYVEEASCPDGLCMKMGRISKQNQSIICLPNKVVISIIDDNNEEIDGVAK